MRTCTSSLAVLVAAAWLLAAPALHAQSTPAEELKANIAATEKAAQSASKAASAAATSATAAEKAASAAEKAAPTAWRAPDTWLLYGVPLFVLLASYIAIWRVDKSLKAQGSKWSLADALSEEVMMPTDDPATPGKPLMDKDSKVVLIPEMHASSSRVIALMGMMAIIFLFLGFGVFAIFEFGATGKVPESLERVTTFLTAGLTLFAPYVVNKFTSVFKPTAAAK